MKVLNREIFEAKEPLERLIQLPLPVKTSLEVARFANKLSDELRAIEEVRMGLFRKYGSPSEDGCQLVVEETSDKYPKFLSELDELMMQETEVVVGPISLPPEVDGKPLNIEPSILMALEKFVDVE